MKKIHKIALALAFLAMGLTASAQDSGSSARMRTGSRTQKGSESNSEVSTRMQSRLHTEPTSDADLQWMKVIYRTLDLNKEANAPLYFPEMPVNGDENLFRIIMRLLAAGQIDAYEYLDGREMFTDQYKLKVRDLLDQYHIYYQDAKGSSDRHPKFTIDESDVPSTEVLSYYVIERWEFDNRTNKMRTVVEAICPVLHRTDDYGMEALKYPMFWVKYDDLRPYLSTQNIFISDANNLPTCTYDDYFRLALYDGDIYKTRNLRNKSMRQLYPDPEDMKRAQDSIQAQLDGFENKLWVPTLEELQAQREKAEELAAAAEAAEGDAAVDGEGDQPEKPKTTTRRATKKTSKKESKPTKVKRAKAPKTSGGKSSGGATRSVRDRKR